MRLTICLTTIALCCAGSAVAAPSSAKFQLMKTTWTFTEKGTADRESIDADGNYITQTLGGKHLDHGTAVMKDGKACFTSAMSKEGEMCWTTRAVAVGHSMQTVNDKGRKLVVHRAAYMPLKMPK